MEIGKICVLFGIGSWSGYWVNLFMREELTKHYRSSSYRYPWTKKNERLLEKYCSWSDNILATRNSNGCYNIFELPVLTSALVQKRKSWLSMFIGLSSFLFIGWCEAYVCEIFLILDGKFLLSLIDWKSYKSY